MNYCTICGDETSSLTCSPCEIKEEKYKNFEVSHDAQKMSEFSLRKLEIQEWSKVGKPCMKDIVDTAFCSLSMREELVLRSRLGLPVEPLKRLVIEDGDVTKHDIGHGKTLKEIAKECGVTIERIRQIEAKALRKCRYRLNKRSLREYLDNYWTPHSQSQVEFLTPYEKFKSELDKQREDRKRIKRDIELYNKEKKVRMHESLKKQRGKVVESFEGLSLKREERMYKWNNRPKEFAMYQIGDSRYSCEQLVSGIERVIKEYESNLKFKETKCLMYPMHEKWGLFVKIYSQHVAVSKYSNGEFRCVTSTLNSCDDFKNVVASGTKFFFLLCGADNDYEALEMFKDL